MPAVAGTASTSSRDAAGAARRARLRGREAFGRVYAEGSRFRGRALRLTYTMNALGITRLGFSVSARMGGAVLRNAFRRRVRQLVHAECPPGLDIVVGVRIPLAEIPWRIVREEFTLFQEELRSRSGLP